MKAGGFVPIDRRGGCRPAGIGGGILGHGVDIIVVDDPIKGLAALSTAERRRVAEFYDNTLVTRLNDGRKGTVVIIMQRLHRDDIVGHLLDRDDRDVISLPAIATSDTVHQLSAHPVDVHRRSIGDLLQSNSQA